MPWLVAASLYSLPQSSHDLFLVHRFGENSLVSLLKRILILLDQGPILMTSLNLNFLSTANIAAQGLSLQHLNFRDKDIQSIMFSFYTSRPQTSCA